MTLSSDQIARLNADLIDYKYRVFVSGPRGSVAEQDIAEGQPYTSFPETTIESAFEPTDTVLNVMSTSAFPSSGGLFVGTWGEVTSGEFIWYQGKTSTSFTGVFSTDPTKGYPGPFAFGTEVSNFIDVTNKVTSFSFNEVLQDVEGTWSIQLSGVDYDSVLLAQNNMIVVMVSYSPEPTDVSNWSDQVVLCSGYITPSSVQDDYKRGASWSLMATGLNLYTSKTDMQAKRFGRANLLENSSATGSAHLVDSAILGYPGEVIGRQTMEPDKAIDGSMSTSYCSLAIPAVVPINDTLGNVSRAVICEIGFGPVGTGLDGAYMVIWSGNDIPMRVFSIQSERSGVPPIATHDNENLPSYPAFGRLILCQNREVFESWAGPQETEVFEWRVISDFTLRPEGDSIRFLFNWLDGSELSHYQNQIKWGDFSGATLPALNYGEAYYVPATGNPLTDPQWTKTDTPVPGRNTKASSWAYISAEIPPLAITLASEMSSSVPGVGGAITVSPSTAGLKQDGGEVIIGTERITYSSATETTLIVAQRGANSTTAATHLVGANVYPMESGVSTSNDFIDLVSWKRKVIYDEGVAVVPSDFEIYTSKLASPLYPSTDTDDFDWRTDWEWLSFGNGHNAFSWDLFNHAGRRARHVMMLCYKMLNDGRFILSELEAKRAGNYDPSSTVVSSVGEVFLSMFLDDFGLPIAQINIENLAGVSHDFVATRGRLSDRLNELAAQTGSTIYYNRDNTITITRSPWHPLGALVSVTHTLTRDNLRSASFVESQRNVVSQVILNMRNPQTKETFQVSFPPNAQTLGEQIEIERVFLGSSSEARYLAEMIYKQLNNQDRVDVVLKGHGDGFKIGQRVLLTWDMDRAGNKFSGKSFIITGISFTASRSMVTDKRAEWRLTLQEYWY